MKIKGTDKKKEQISFQSRCLSYSAPSVSPCHEDPFQPISSSESFMKQITELSMDKETRCAHPTEISFRNIEMQIANIQPSSSPGIRANSGSTSNRCCGLNQILFCFWWFHHHWLTKKRLARKCYCHGDRHDIIELNIPASIKKVVYNHT